MKTKQSECFNRNYILRLPAAITAIREVQLQDIFNNDMACF